MNRYSIPHDLFFGAGSLYKLAQLKGEKALLVVPQNAINQFGFVNTAKGYLETSGIEVKLIENIDINSTDQDILDISDSIRDFKPEFIIAIGDGSVIDTSKGIWFFYENPDITVEDMKKHDFNPNVIKKSTFIAIPTTLSSSMELSAFTINTSIDFEIVPDIVILDSELTNVMSKELMAYTGMNALTHALESIASTKANDFTEPSAMNAIRMLYKYLYRAYNGDKSAQEKVHYAQYQAGMAFSNSSSGIAHAISHQFASAFQNIAIPHGLINAICLPHIVQFNSKVELTALVYGEVSKIVGLKCDDTETAVQALITSIRDCNTDLNIPSCVKNFNNGILTEKEFLENIDQLVDLTLQDCCIKTAPRQPSKDELIQILKCCYYGDFCDI